MGLLSTVWCTDEDVAVVCGPDYPEICPRDCKLAQGKDGAFLGTDRWTLTSPTNDFQALGVAPGSVVQLLGPSSAFVSPEMLVVSAVGPNSATLRRKYAAPGVGMPPSPAGGTTGVSFLIATFYPEIERASYELDREFQIDDLVNGRKSADLYDPRELREACTQLVLWRSYQKAARQAGDSADSYMAKARQARAEYDAVVARTLVHFRNNYPGNDETYRTCKLVR